MEGTSFLRGQPLTTVPSSQKKVPPPRMEEQSDCQVFRFEESIRFSKVKVFDLSLRASDKGPIKASSAVTDASPTNSEFKEQDLVFVAGATGKVGSRTVRELLKLGFRVRAGVRSAQRAKGLVQSVKDMNTDEGTQPVEKLEVVECDLEKKDSIQPALGNASVVICCIGASEKEISDITGPYRIDYLATKNLVDAERKAEEALIASGLNYAIVRPGEWRDQLMHTRRNHNLTLALDDTLFGGQVSNLQVAELLACMAKNPQLSCSKIVEVVAETTAPLTPIEKLLKRFLQNESVAARKRFHQFLLSLSSKNQLQPKCYEDLKPPTSPIPATALGATKAKEVDATPVPEVEATQAPVEAPM
ncbi:hypothetical protein HID58_091715 [Brassica napus]|uniref:NAD(P)-binding domain-containing protein n=1 Tax=Brassica napus TaxID=3708 RepID=A0ABQ7WZ43_BRANA|nr:hypothetical protein HID58_091715 [Brassica napus]